MVDAGWAIDWPYYSSGRYRVMQEDARQHGRGIWEDGGLPSVRMFGRMVRPGSRPKQRSLAAVPQRQQRGISCKLMPSTSLMPFASLCASPVNLLVVITIPDAQLPR